MRIAALIKTRLNENFTPSRLDIVDDSHRHEGHSGARPSGETHFNVVIVSSLFEGKSRVTRHRMVFDVLKDLMDAPVHALTLSTLTPDEAASGQ